MLIMLVGAAPMSEKAREKNLFIKIVQFNVKKKKKNT